MGTSSQYEWLPHRLSGRDLSKIKDVIPDYEKIILATLCLMLDRYERRSGYPYIDMKFSTLDGTDFDDTGPAYKASGVIFGWIQGRGIEALAAHASWLERSAVLPEHEKQALIRRIQNMLTEVTANMQAIRKRNRGRISFAMDTCGTPLRILPDGTPEPVHISGRTSYSDLFLAKGLIAAGGYLKRSEWMRDGQEYLHLVLKEIREELFEVDQPQTPAVEDSREEGPWMIALGAIALAYEQTGDPRWLTTGKTFIDHLYTHHLNHGQWPHLQVFDFVETIDEQGTPLLRDDSIPSNVGHFMEYLGLGLKIIRSLKVQNDDFFRNEFSDYLEWMTKSFLHNFTTGFNQQAGGITLSIDLLSRAPVKSHMPWWSCPETMRAAMQLLELANPENRPHLYRTFARCSDAYLFHYVNPKVSLAGFQTRDAGGTPIDIIPATPDADPGYHTGLCLIDVIDVYQRMDHV